jgi:hypothetical protein
MFFQSRCSSIMAAPILHTAAADHSGHKESNLDKLRPLLLMELQDRWLRAMGSSARAVIELLTATVTPS